jgi:glycosyltransferase involved in cell wall biosynthesis
MIIGSAPEEYVEYRMKHAATKLTLRYSERIYKGGRWRVLSPRGAINRLKTYYRYLDKPLYMLCASAYTAGDLAMLGSYLGRCYKWGYFPQVYTYDLEELLSKKEKNSLLWVARMIDWKHPEVPILVAKRLKEKGYQFHLKMVGVGPLLDEMEKLIAKYRLEECVHLLGSMSPQEVRGYMESSSIFMFTSDQNEGWGAVLNEAMNSGCAVVANQQIGSVPFLLNDGRNGRVYYKNKINKIVKIIEDLFNDEEKTLKLGKNAYDTIVNHWSAKNATERLVKVCTRLLVGKKEFFEDGPCSKAKIRVKKG